MGDEYLTEYVPDSAKRVAFLTGFTGSAAVVVVLEQEASFFTDGRYTLQASRQVPDDLFAIYDAANVDPFAWTSRKAVKGARLGFDPALQSTTTVRRWRQALAEGGIEMVAVSANPIDAVWTDRPAAPMAPIVPYPVAYAGHESKAKRQTLADSLIQKGLDCLVLAHPPSIAWLLNIRGGDTPCEPLPLSFALLHADATVDWFVDPAKVTDALPGFLGPEVRIHPREAFISALSGLGKEKKTVRFDPNSTSFLIAETLEQAGAVLKEGEDPCLLAKACKNEVEIDGMRACHKRDGAALVSLLAWLDRQTDVTEQDVEKELEKRRAKVTYHRGPSFNTIAGSGPQGAIVHYQSSAETNRHLQPGEFFLLDSGAQYLDGTTDVTRTVPIGEVTAEMKDRFTRVLKGHIAIANARFPVGTSGGDLDVLARQHLWAVGCDYGHGTGHGVGCYLGVHEGPQAISKRNIVPLKPGMVVSNEPGYYKTGAYGIRIENLVAVVEIETADAKMLGFETLTLAPIDRRAIAPALMTNEEIAWLNAYHNRVYSLLLPLIEEEETKTWLRKATLPL